MRAFSAYAETGAVQAAADALNVTPAAISQQIRALEQHLSLSLVDRSERRLRLTAEGQALARALSRGFGEIAQSVRELVQMESDRPLHIATTASFASFWLMPRLPGFRRDNPGVDILINPSPSLVTLSPGGVDAAIRFGLGDWPGMQTVPLVTAPLVIVAAPALVQGRSALEPEELRALPWLVELGQDEATTWIRALGVEGRITGGVTEVPGNMKLDAARAGHGVTPVSRVFVEDDLRQGRLVALFEAPEKKGYHLCLPHGVLRAPLKAFAKWIVAEAGRNVAPPGPQKK